MAAGTGNSGDNGDRDDRGNSTERFIERSTRSFQERAEQAGPAAGASYTLIGAILVLGGLGYAIDRWLGTPPWFLVGGLLLGIVVGMWELAKTVWRR